MKRINPLRSRAIWIFLLNAVLILIPISGFYFINRGSQQALQQRSMNLYNCSHSIVNLTWFVSSEEALRAAPVLAPYQRIIIVSRDGTADSRWQSNPGFVTKDPLYAFLARLLLKDPGPPDLGREEIVTRLARYFDAPAGRMGVINYRFMYSVLPIRRDKIIIGSSILLFDKSDIQRTESLNKLLLAFFTVVSGLLAVAVSCVYYRLFIRPLFDLTREAGALPHRHGASPDVFPLRNRKDEIGQLSRALYESGRKLIGRKEAVESFTGDVLHELKNPLTAIRNGVEILERINQAKGSVETGEILSIISRESGRIEKLLYDIKELSLYEDRRPGVESCDPSAVIREAASLYGEHGVKLDIHAPGGRPIGLSREKLGCILKNLIDNAVDFSPAFGSVTVAYEETDRGVALSVSDLGKGIPDHEKPRVFERFYSNRDGAEAATLHSGLGLAIVSKILQSGGGSIQCLDNRPSGCRFVVTFQEGAGAGFL